MVMKKRRNMQMAYVADEAAMEEQAKFRKICKNLILQIGLILME